MLMAALAPGNRIRGVSVRFGRIRACLDARDLADRRGPAFGAVVVGSPCYLPRVAAMPFRKYLTLSAQRENRISGRLVHVDVTFREHFILTG